MFRAVELVAVCVFAWPLQPVQLTSVTGYLVEYTSHCDNRRNTTQVGNVNTTIIEGLYSYSNYTLRMTVVCNSTVSPTFSPPHTFITPSERKLHYCPVFLSLPTLTPPPPVSSSSPSTTHHPHPTPTCFLLSSLHHTSPSHRMYSCSMATSRGW